MILLFLVVVYGALNCFLDLAHLVLDTFQTFGGDTFNLVPDGADGVAREVNQVFGADGSVAHHLFKLCQCNVCCGRNCLFILFLLLLFFGISSSISDAIEGLFGVRCLIRLVCVMLIRNCKIFKMYIKYYVVVVMGTICSRVMTERKQCQYLLCKSSDFPDFVDNFPDFFTIFPDFM